MKTLRYFVFFVFHVAFLDGFSQREPLRFDHLETAAGLSHNQITYIFKDQKGFMWFATQSGLNRYDGTNFKIFRNDENDSTSPGDNSFSGIFELPEAKLGMLTPSRELNIYDQSTEKFDRNYKKYFRRWHLPEEKINSIRIDAYGNYWFLYSKGGLYKYNPGNGTTLRVPLNLPVTSEANAPVINAFSQDTKGNTWVVYNNGYLQKIDNLGNEILHRSFLQTANKNKTTTYSIFIDAQDDLWISVLDYGVFYYNPHTGSFLHLHASAARGRLNSNSITMGLQGIVQGNDGKIWIATNDGINLLDKNDFSVQHLTHEKENRNSISQNAVLSLYKDNADFIWAGTYKQGVNFYNKSLDKFPLLKHYSTDPNSLPYDDVNRFAEDAKGNLWIGTNGGGLIYFDRGKNKFSRFTHNPADPNSLCGDIIVSLCIDHEQKLWIGTYTNGMDSYDGKTFTHYRNSPDVPESISENNIWEIFEDSKHNLWVGTINKGLDRFDREKKIFYHYRNGEPDLKASDFSSLYVSALAEDKAGNILVGTSTGLEILNTQTKHFAYYTLPLGAGNNFITDIKVDSRGLIWLATSKGINLFDPQKKTFKVFRKKDGLPDDMVLTILEDDMHNLWVSTAKGLCNVIIEERGDKNTSLSLHFKNYDKTDGLQGIEFNENAAFKTKKDGLVFGGPYGINIFKPGNILADQRPPGIMLTDFKIFDKSVKAGEIINGRIVLSLAFSETKTIRLKYDENFFSIQFASLDFSQAKKNKFEYKLEGFNKDWVVRSSIEDNKATYTNLDPGLYTFKIRAVNNEGIASKTLSVQIIVIPPFWMTWWFRFSILMAVAGGVFSFFRFRIRRINNQKIKLQAQVNEQTQQLLKSNEEEQRARKEAEQANEYLEIKNKEMEQFAYIASHDLQEPLRTTSSFVKILQKQYKGKFDERADKYFAFISDASDRMKVLIKNLLDFSRIGAKREVEVVDCDRMLRTVLADLGRVISETQADIHYDQLPVIDGYAIELNQLFQNLITNAIKFRKKNSSPTIIISAKKKEDYWEFAFKDNGIGIDKDHYEKIFAIFQRLHTQTEYEGSGIGLSHCKKIVELHHGKIWVESMLNAGSTFYFTIHPLKEKIRESKIRLIHTYR